MLLSLVVKPPNSTAQNPPADRSRFYLPENGVFQTRFTHSGDLNNALSASAPARQRVLIDERPDGVHLFYDRMASFLAPYENAAALKVAKDLDAKVEALLASAAA